MSGCNAENRGTSHFIIREFAQSLSQLPIYQSAQVTQDSIEVSQGQLNSPLSKIQGVYNLVQPYPNPFSI
jgi:hypothetical protein